MGQVEALELVRSIDAEASAAAQKNEERKATIGSAEKRIIDAEQKLGAANEKHRSATNKLKKFRDTLQSVDLEIDTSRERIETVLAEDRKSLDNATRCLRVLSTVSQNAQIEQATSASNRIRSRLERARSASGRARRAERAAAALHDATRRAAAETLDMRLERMLPLLSELYSRLRPHPVWQDIEYLIRGDLRKFLSLQVGQGLNPQFLFSSGQRRATGLAFLLSIKISLSWNIWKSVLLDDPVQHVDDFRTVNLAELLAQLVASGRQIIVAVEDAALAELLSRRMPVSRTGEAIHLTLGIDDKGSSSVLRKTLPVPMISRAFAA